MVVVVVAYANTTMDGSNGTATNGYFATDIAPLALGHSSRTLAQSSCQVQGQAVQSMATSPWVLPLIPTAPPELTTAWCERNNDNHFKLSSGLVTPRSIRGPPDNAAAFKES
jgi:hypothetical protein